MVGQNLQSKLELIQALELRTQKAAQDNFLTFIQTMNPLFVVSRHHEVIAEKLEAVERGDTRRLIVTMPPRSGKSLMVSEYFPTWYLGRHPTHQALAVSYTGDFAKQWGKKVRDYIETDEYRTIFPNTQISRNTRAAATWTTTAGGIYNSAGITSGIAGKGAHIGLIDDPLNEQDAYSKAAREHVIRWWPAGFLSRLMPNGRIVVLSTRWNEEDLIGYVLQEAKENPEQAQWEILSIPAILDKPTATLLGPPCVEGETFWPVNEAMVDKAQLAGWPTQELLEKKASLPDYQWQALYMQRPSAVEGAIIKRDDWQLWQGLEPPECEYTLLSCDTAFETTNISDFSALCLWGVFADPNKEKMDLEPGDYHFICLSSEKGRWEYPELRQKVRDTYAEHRPDVILIEKKASGQSLIQELQRSLLPVAAYQPDKDKVARAHACSPAFHQGRVWIPDPLKYTWAEQLMDECARFSATGSAKDDLVDATTQAVLWVRDNFLLNLSIDKWNDDWNDWEEPAFARRRGY